MPGKLKPEDIPVEIPRQPQLPAEPVVPEDVETDEAPPEPTDDAADVAGPEEASPSDADNIFGEPLDDPAAAPDVDDDNPFDDI